MPELSPWLAAATPVDSGWLIPGRTRARGCDLLLAPDHVGVSADAVWARLEWSDHGRTELESPKDTWGLGAWKNDYDVHAGIGLHVTGRCAEAVHEVCRRRPSVLNRIDRLLEKGVRVPLFPLGTNQPAVTADRLTIEVLCTVLARRPDARARLREPDRVRRLLGDLAGAPQGPIEARAEGGARGRRRAEIVIAMHTLGYEHRLGGRPLPDEDRPPVDVLTKRVIDRVHASPWAEGIRVDEDDVRPIVEVNYSSIAPWPFGALLD